MHFQQEIRKINNFDENWKLETENANGKKPLEIDLRNENF